jgi:O-acetylhomoserine (thiol)-lyase
VNHPSATKSPFQQLAKKYFSKGSGALLSFGFKGDKEQLNQFITSLSYFSYQANLGDVRSLIVNSPKTTHAELDEQHLIRSGISYDTVRISVGLEAAQDLIEDLKQAFERAFH